jgi:hypothetical protein
MMKTVSGMVPSTLSEETPLRKAALRISDPCIVTLEREAVETSYPEDRGKAGNRKTVHEHGEEVLRADKTAVE